LSPVEEDLSERAADWKSAAPCFAGVPQRVNNPKISRLHSFCILNNLFGNKIPGRMVLLIDGLGEK
jgi:hypothetical protein